MGRDGKTKKRVADLQTFGQVLSLLKPYKKQLFIMSLCFAASTIIGFFQPLIISRITDFGMVGKSLLVIIQSVIFLLILIVAGQLIEVMQAHLFADIHNSVHFGLSARGFNKLLHLKISYFTDKNSAEVIENMKTDVSNVASITDQSFQFTIGYIFRVISGLAGLLVISWELTVIVVLMVPVKYIIVNLIAKSSEKLTEEQLKNFSTFTGWFSDNVNGVKEIKLWGIHVLGGIQIMKIRKTV